MQIALPLIVVGLFVFSVISLCVNIILIARVSELNKEEESLREEGKRLLIENLYMRDLTDHEIELGDDTINEETI